MTQKQFPTKFIPQHQNKQPGIEKEMTPIPLSDDPNYVPSGKLKDKVAIITGGDSGIGRAVSILFAKEGASVFIPYFDEDVDAEDTKKFINDFGGKCEIMRCDLRTEEVCKQVVQNAIQSFGKINILVNNAAVQYPQKNLEDITEEQLRRTFETNIFSMFFLSKACLPHMKQGDSIINTASITAYKGHDQLIDYSATKGAIVTFTRSLSTNLAQKGIRVNGVAPGPIWTPLIPASFDEQEVAKFGSTTPMKRAGQPVELAPAYLYLASNEASYITGQMMHVNGGVIVNG
ncbi:NAD(P)-dependent oxidoreductase [Bacillus sp. AFS002410]|uniref:SDR family oxidoreductase n=1 Tax=Bacillus sp. AFS002410 TaxID=2033481 RepID=UPI000BF13079|nr:SDR family oxidoreductase [Bacillus sp. AFS002410]PEJ56728.1 NAD(P)-dependent oxidoreductase [Bacillus sp. AFS002410]